MSGTSDEENQILLVRPNKNQWWMAAFLGAMSFMALSLPFLTPRPTEVGMIFFFGVLWAIFFFPTAFYALFLAKAFLRADENALTWRGALAEKSLKWNEITDYFEAMSGGQLYPFVIGANKKINLATYADNSADLLQLKALVQRRAINALSTQWKQKLSVSILRGEKIVTLPQTFSYSKADHWLAAVILPIGLVLLLFLDGSPQDKWSRWQSDIVLFYETYGTIAALLLIAGYILGAAFLLFFPLLLSWMIANSTNSRFKQHITASEEGIHFEDDGVSIKSAWDDIVEYSRVQQSSLPAYQLVTKNGSFDFSNSISNFRLLHQLIQERATHAKLNLERELETIIGGEATTWSGGKIGEGERVFHYRTSTSRVLIFGAFTVSFIMLGLFLVFHFVPDLAPPSKPDSTGTTPILIVATCMMPATLGMWISYRKSHIQISEIGLTARGFWGTTSLRWDEIVEYAKDENYSYYFARGKKKRIVFRPSLTHLEELKTEIAKCAVNAQKRGW